MQPKYKFTFTRLKFALIVAISIFSFTAKAQETDSVRIAINSILAPLNKALIPTGILAENSYPLLDLSVYNGQLTADNTIDFSQWRLLYNQALSGAYAAPVGFGPSGVLAELTSNFWTLPLNPDAEKSFEN